MPAIAIFGRIGTGKTLLALTLRNPIAEALNNYKDNNSYHHNQPLTTWKSTNSTTSYDILEFASFEDRMGKGDLFKEYTKLITPHLKQIQTILYLVKVGMRITEIDSKLLEFLNLFKKPIHVVFTNSEYIEYGEIQWLRESLHNAFSGLKGIHFVNCNYQNPSSHTGIFLLLEEIFKNFPDSEKYQGMIPYWKSELTLRFLTEKNENLDQEVLKLRLELALAAEEIKKEKIELKTIKEELIQKEQDSQEREARLAEENSKLRSLLSTTQKALNEKNQQLDSTRVSLTLKEAQLQESEARVATEKASWQGMLTNTQKTLDEQREQLQETKQTHLDYLNQEQDNLKQLAEALQQRETELKQKQQELEAVKQQLGSVRQEYTDWQQKESVLLGRQEQLEQEKFQLLQDREILQTQCEALIIRIDGLETQQKELSRYQEAAEGLDQLKKLLQESQQELSNREKEWQSKQGQADKAEQNYREAHQKVTQKAELLAVQLSIFQQQGLPPKERAFQQFLNDNKRQFKKEGFKSPACFISYAWEDDSTPEGKAANKDMQHWLGRLAGDLRKLGLKEVFFDLDNMHGSLRDTMRENIDKSDYFLLIATPRLKQRIEAGLTPILKECLENGLLNELQQGLQKVKDNKHDKAEYDPKNNATFEFVHIWSKVHQKPDALIPLQYSGSFADAVPLTIGNALIRDAREAHSKDEYYYSLLADLSAPLGVIPAIYQLRNKDRQASLKEYKSLVEGFNSKLENINLKLEAAETKVMMASSSTNTQGAFYSVLAGGQAVAQTLQSTASL